ncbi:hypothetical protein B0H13DRAFT_581112 [Mycena leptocephala]|nr:hypothetical protein B0H13DRAFT_581112 [Mycena leptocephala]
MSLYTLSVQSADGIQWNPGNLHAQKPNLYVKIFLDRVQIGRTRTMKRTIAPHWNDQTTILSGKPTAVVSFKLFHDTSVPMRKDPCLGTLDIQSDALLNLCTAETDRIASLQLVAVEGTSKGKPSGTLSVQVHNVTPALVGRAIDEARNDAEVCQLGNPVSGAGNLATGLKEVITKLDIFIKVVDGVSEINPYARAAWKLLTLLYEAVKSQQATDNKTLELVQNMVEVYSFVEDVESLSQKIKRLENVVTEITKQTLECAIFLREYTGHGFTGKHSAYGR